MDAEDGRGWIVRVPVPGTDRSTRFHAEAAVGKLLHDAGHPVTPWDVVDVDGVACAVGRRLRGAPIEYGQAWTPAFSAQLGALLSALHTLPTTGFGPLMDDATALRGEAQSAIDGVRRRWCWATCWPFDGSDMSGHPVTQLMPDLVPTITQHREQLLDIAEDTVGLVHSDLHREHLLGGPDGNLTGVLDFGDAFIGSIAWDFALLHWYYGAQASQAVAERHPNGSTLSQSGRTLAIAVGVYKLAKSPTDAAVPQRLRRVLSHK